MQALKFHNRFIQLLITFVITSTIFGQIYTEKDIDDLLYLAEKDSMAKTERLAALEFHKLLNIYREDKNLNALAWDETLWITSRNHCVNMNERNYLSHTQSSGSKHFTGASPGDRYNYASGGDSFYSWSGENALYNYSCYGKSCIEKAKQIAKRSFNQWKNSPGHNANMLGSHSRHGSAFLISSNGRVWGTDLFARGGENRTTSPKRPIKIKRKSRRFSTYKTQNLIKENLFKLITESFQKIKQKSKIEQEAKRLARKNLKRKAKQNSSEGIIYTNLNSYESKTMMGLVKKEKTTYSVVIKKNKAEFNIETITQELISLIKQNILFPKNSKMGLCIAVRNKNNNIKLSLTCSVETNISKIPIF